MPNQMEMDPGLAHEMVDLLNRELKTVRARVQTLEVRTQ